MDGLKTVAKSFEQFGSPAELANAWQGADEKAHADGSARSFSQQRSVKDVDKQALDLLRNDEKRSGGVVLLSSITRVCSSEHFIERCRPWIQQLVSTLGRCGPEAQAGIAHLLCQLLHRASEFANLTAGIAPFMSPIVDRLIRATPEWRVDALTCLKTCIQCYPAQCLSSKEKIINALLPLLDIGEEETQEIVAQCMAVAPCIGADGGNAATKHAEVWLLWCNMILATLNDTLDKLVSPIEQVQTPLIGVPSGPGGVPDPPDKLPLEDPTESEPNRSAVLLVRCQSLCCCLKHLLRTAYPVAVSFPLQGILAVSCRILALSIQQLVTHPSLECVLLFSALPAFYSSAVDLLTAITCSCKQFLLPQRWLIDQLLLQAFGWTGADSTNHTSPYSCVRISLYRLLTAWLWVVGGGVDQGSAMHFVKHILNDAKPVRKEDKIELLKAANQERQVGDATSVEPTDVDIAANPELTLSALEALSALLMAAGSVLSAECHKAIQLFLIPVILEINAAHRPSSGLPPPKGWWTAGNAPAPYGRADCRKELYNTLLSCALTDDHLRAPPLHHAIQLFVEGKRDPNMEVSRLCCRAVCVCKLMTHPRLPLSLAMSGGPSSSTGTQPETPASARLAMQRSVAAQQKDLQETIRKNLSSQEDGGHRSSQPLAPPSVVADLSQAESSTIHCRRMKKRKGSAASTSSPSDDPTATLASTAPSASATAAESSEAASSTAQSRAQATGEPAEAPAATSPARTTSTRTAGTPAKDAAVQQAQGEPPAKRLRESTPEAALRKSASSPAAKKAANPTAASSARAPEGSGEVSGMLGAFVDSGPDSGADSGQDSGGAGE